ncbi:hypothetical protein P308_00980 [Pseudomonas piscis]|nr:hypothetical protein P308_00980 [Pseudomonas piscis]
MQPGQGGQEHRQGDLPCTPLPTTSAVRASGQAARAISAEVALVRIGPNWATSIKAMGWPLRSSQRKMKEWKR